MITFALGAEAYVPFLSLLLRLVSFLLRIWLLKALFLFTLPDFVRRKRFAAALCVFILGILSLLSKIYCVLLRRNYHRHVSSLEFGLLFNSSRGAYALAEAFKKLLAQLCVLDLTSPELDDYLDLVAAAEELYCRPELGFKIVCINRRR